MEALVGHGGATVQLRGRPRTARHFECSSHLLSRNRFQQFNILRFSPAPFIGSLSSIEVKNLLPAQGDGVRRLESVRVFAQVGEETESTQENASTREESNVKAKGFGAPKPVTEKKKTSSSAPSSNTRRAPPQQPLLGNQVDEETKQFETGAVAALVFVFSLIILEGIGLAASGFLPQEWDEFMIKVIYPIFTPTVGVFLGGAAAYGVWKYLGGGEKKGPSK
ncbi:hypothetical protein MPTK1_1g26360 [Marchantia polymorpha subsp. ruderalis]|uniref:Uncharacterized protein n=2 Tax=Marchantia polymorpha TaxID=3197 RepID=A0AAF6AUH3_MARPO|nr:hypothetical protein MARPO_0002s0242 [Marchantia polymorpha]BBN00094.1 hypothetical protein Mp_1g26360 [Marchantia polymorpha subsp. ruderalis]|eukprot:PTQ49791.1 hypothetical protein MARPO_0002s0242 [Marchantia polymorpha]